MLMLMLANITKVSFLSRGDKHYSKQRETPVTSRQGGYQESNEFNV